MTLLPFRFLVVCEILFFLLLLQSQAPTAKRRRRGRGGDESGGKLRHTLLLLLLLLLLPCPKPNPIPLPLLPLASPSSSASSSKGFHIYPPLFYPLHDGGGGGGGTHCAPMVVKGERKKGLKFLALKGKVNYFVRLFRAPIKKRHSCSRLICFCSQPIGSEKRIGGHISLRSTD